MRRRQVLILLASTATALMRALGAGAADQRPTGLFRIAFLESTSVQSFRDALEQGLRENGLVPGQTIVIDYRTPAEAPNALTYSPARSSAPTLT